MTLGGFYYIPLEVQKKVFDKMGRQDYIKPPKSGTNPRGLRIHKRSTVESSQWVAVPRTIEIKWQKTKIEFQSL